jgi:hypothetical protein
VPVEVSEEEAELSSIVSEIDDAVGADAEDEPLLSPAGGKVAGRALGADGGSSSVNSFRRMRILLVFNQATCTSAERVIGLLPLCHIFFLTLCFQKLPTSTTCSLSCSPITWACPTGSWCTHAAPFQVESRIATRLLHVCELCKTPFARNGVEI